MPEHMDAAVITSDAAPGTEPLEWDQVRQRFAAERWYWLAGSQGCPQSLGDTSVMNKSAGTACR